MRRIHTPDLHPGRLTLDAEQSHHLRDVLRMSVGDDVELFDSLGRTAAAVVTDLGPPVDLSVAAIHEPATRFALTVAAAVPKGDRADWMVEKLSEIGVARFIPLATARSVVHPTGRGKTDRWQRIAIESAKQSRRPGVMSIDPLTDLTSLDVAGAWVLSTVAGTMSAADAASPAIVLIGPEGGWTDDELTHLTDAGAVAVGLTPTILRVETAAVVTAGLIACRSRLRLPVPSPGTPGEG